MTTNKQTNVITVELETENESNASSTFAVIRVCCYGCRCIQYTSHIFGLSASEKQCSKDSRRKKLITLVFMKHPTFGGTGETIL
jgi:hypothetical protein